MKTKRKIVITVIVMAIFFVLTDLLKKDLWDINAELLKDEVLSIEQSAETVNLTDLTPFEWDTAYSFDPYTPKDTIFEIVGYKWDNINETVSEGMNQLVFLKDEKVVCYLYGYPENNGYGIFFFNQNDKGSISSSVLTNKDDLLFEVMRHDYAIILLKDELLLGTN